MTSAMGGRETFSVFSGEIRVLLGATMISFSPIWVKLAHVGPNTITFYRAFLGGIILTILALARGLDFRRGLKAYLLAAVCAVFFNLDLSFWHYSIGQVGPGLATILGNCQVFFLAGVGMIFFGERLSWRQLVAIPLALGGLWLLFGVEWQALGPGFRIGVVFGLLTAVAYAAYLLTLRHAPALERPLPAMLNIAVISLLTAAFAAVEVPAMGESFVIPDLQTGVVLFCLGLFSQALGWILISTGLPRVAPSRAGLFLLLQPALAFVWDVIIFGRSASLREVGGVALALGAIYLGSMRKKA